MKIDNLDGTFTVCAYADGHSSQSGSDFYDWRVHWSLECCACSPYNYSSQFNAQLDADQFDAIQIDASQFNAQLDATRQLDANQFTASCAYQQRFEDRYLEAHSR